MRRKKCQSIIEYTILIAIAVAAATAMKTYVRRAMQAHLKVVQDQINVPEDIYDVEFKTK